MESAVLGTSPSQGGVAAKRPWRRKVRRVAVTLSVVLLVLLGVAFMLPIWASTEQGRAYVLEQVNRQINGTVSVQSWRLGWFSGIRLHGVAVTNKQGQQVLQCSSLQTDLTLWSWLWGHYDLGTTVISLPRVTARRYADGSNDLSRIFGGGEQTAGKGAGRGGGGGTKFLSSLRGAIQIERGEVVLSGTGAGPEIHLTGLYAEVPIASAATPIHLTLRAMGDQGSPTKAVTVEGNLPALTQWQAGPIAFLRDMEIAGGGLPTATLAEWLGLDPAWQQAVGPTIEEISLVNRQVAGSPTSSPSFRLRGATGAVDIKLLLQRNSQKAILSLPGTGDFHARVTLGMARPVTDLLGYINPALTRAAVGKGTVDVVALQGQVALDEPAAGIASGVLTLRGVELRSAGLLEQAWAMAAKTTAPATAPQTLPATIPPTRVNLAEGRVSCEGLLIALPERPRMRFSGTVGLDRSVALLLTLSGGAADTLGGATVEIPIRGTIDRPAFDQRLSTELH